MRWVARAAAAIVAAVDCLVCLVFSLQVDSADRLQEGDLITLLLSGGNGELAREL